MPTLSIPDDPQEIIEAPMQSIYSPSSAMQHLRDIPYLWRVVIFLMVTYFLSGAAFVVRPDGPVAQNLALRTHVTADVWSMLLWVMIPTLAFAFYLYRNLYVIMASMAPFIAILLIQTWHVISTPSESFFHVIIGGSIIMAIIFMFVGAVEVDTLDQVNTSLQKENLLLQEQVRLLKQQVQDTSGDA